MLEKTLVSYNYETKTASWKIVVNHNETALTGVELTDDMPTGLTLDTSSVMLGETSLADDGRNQSTEKQLRITDTDFSSDCESTVYFDTFVDTDVINEGQLKTKPQTTVTNSAKLTYTDPGTGKEEIVTSSEDCVIENPMEKTSSYDKDSGTITYTVKLNSAGIKYSDGNTITLTDALDSQCGVCLDVATICVYRGVVGEDGDITKGAEKLNYSVLYNRKAESDLGLDANSFRLTVPDSTPLYIEYTVDIVDTTKSAYQNNITIDNTDVTASRRQSGISTEGGATGTLSRKGSITLTKVNSKDEGTKIKGAEFELYLLDESTNPATETFFDKGTTDENGQIKFTLLNTDRTYKLVETKAAEGYLSDADSLYSGTVYVGTGDARNVVLEAITNAPLLRVYYNGNGGTTNVTDSVGYEKNENVSVKAPDADGASTTKAGYDFVEWNTEPGGGGTAYNGGDTYPNIQEDTTFYAQWEPAINGSVYKVKHYLQNLDGEGYTEFETEELPGTAEETATAEPKAYEGFTFNEDVEGTVISDIIKGDSTTVLKIYYDRNKYNVTYDGNGGTTSVADENSPYYHGTTVTVKDQGDTAKEGYTFVNWNTEGGLFHESYCM